MYIMQTPGNAVWDFPQFPFFREDRTLYLREVVRNTEKSRHEKREKQENHELRLKKATPTRNING